MTFQGWPTVADALHKVSRDSDSIGSNTWRLDEGQRRSLRAVAHRLKAGLPIRF